MTARPDTDTTRTREAAPDSSLLIALLTPTGRDASIAERVLADTGLATRVCADMPALCTLVPEGIGAAVIAEEALTGSAAGLLIQALDAQDSWSDVPIVVLTGDGELSRALPPGLASVAARANVTLLERPVRVATLVTVLRTALRARQRQYDVRDYLVERDRLHASERSARRQAEDANRAKSEFLAMMSHELRTPLNAIGGYAQLLEMGVRGPVSPEQRADLERIERSQRHLLSLINDVLNFAKLEAGRVDFAIRPVPMRDVLMSVEALVLPQLTTKGIRYVVAQDCTGIMVLADEEKTRQVLVNLYSNAIKFTGADGEIRTSCEADASVVRLTVTDSGSGIPENKLEAIFEPFVQVERGLAMPQEGTGLGLAISRDLARRMGGDLTVASRLGEGASFTLTLPRAPDAA